MIQFGEMYAGGLRERNTPEKSPAPLIYRLDSERSRSQAMPLSNAAVSGARSASDKWVWPSASEMQPQKADVALRSSEWNMGSRSILSFYLSPSPSPLFLPISRVSLATACDSPLTNGSLRTILTTVHYPRLWFFGPWSLPRRAGRRDAFSRNAPEMCCAKRWAGWKADGIRENGAVIFVGLRRSWWESKAERK